MQSLFGAAKPRELVIAQRVGKSEEEILKEEVQKDKLHVRAPFWEPGNTPNASGVRSMRNNCGDHLLPRDPVCSSA
jgi:hypothetical protein